ncbi:MAG: DNA polymerase III subunit alpha [Alphaproteobacteria bacterium CG11_big_fil_rev_8_21_14_0_20_39_49]|nr:MAG: DNA polymerase III subunit alpha [Alphaproteobacteria bacterium CG11_big_fil_rev_8_21_14_0_20_39_49]
MKKEDTFIHLRVHSSYSLLEGAITPKDMVKLCKKYRQPAVAITDSGNLFGSLEFSGACTEEGVQPIIGCIIAVDFATQKSRFSTPIYDKLLLLAKDDGGYLNLLKLVSKSFLETPSDEKAHISVDDLKKYNNGLIALTGGDDGIINRLLLEKQTDAAEKELLNLKNIFGDRLYIELMRLESLTEDETERPLIDFAYKHNIPLVATNDVYFADQGVHEAHDALMCIADGRYVTEQNRKKVGKQNYFKSTREMAELFKDIPEAIENTINIAKRCSVMSEYRKPMLPHFDCGEGRSEAEELKKQAKEGLQLRLETHVYKDGQTEDERTKIDEEYFSRLDFELNVINTMDFPGYFLIVSDFIKWSKKNNIPVGPGRGSGAGSVVAWSLQITDLDPLRFGLLFERFLNPERVSMPDFDIDFCQERREEVIRYVQAKYGRDRVAQIITFGKLQARAVIRDVGRVLQMPYGQIDRISKMIPFNPIDPVTLQKAIDMDRNFKQMVDEDKEIAKLVNTSLKLEGLNRHASTHAAGVVIADRPLEELVPVYRDPRSDMPVCGYSMKYAEGSGLVKFDFLGLKTLTVISKTCEFVRQKGIDIDISKIPIDDKKSFDMISKGDSIGVFQIESAGMRDTLRKMKPDNIEDIIALISLYRPGPMDNIPAYIRRKHGEEEPDYLDPMLEGILKETYGVIIYQEQVMQIAQVMGGYSLGGADLLRRAMGKKIASEMDQQRKIFVDGAIKNGVKKEKASSIFDLVAKFAGYGFNKSHAAAYAMISYQTAYLKAHYPVEFLSASMNLDIHDTDKINTFRAEAVEQKITLLPPDINKSFAYFRPEKTENGELAIRYGLGALKNVGTTAMGILEKERNENGEFKDIFDLASRCGGQVMNKRQMESLVKSGAFDNLHNNRKQIFDAIESILRYSSMVNSEKNSNQSSLFGGDEQSKTDQPKLPETIDWASLERMNNEFESVGLYLNRHPLEIYANILRKINVVPYNELVNTLAGGNNSIKIAGVLIAKKMRSSPRGRFATVSFSDTSGIFEISIFNEDVLSDARDLLEPGTVLLMEVDAKKDDGGIRMNANSVKNIEDLQLNYHLQIHLDNSNGIEKLKETVGEPATRKTKISFVTQTDKHTVHVELKDTYDVSASAIEFLKEIEGVREVIEV